MDYTKTRAEDIAAEFFKGHPNEEVEIAYAEEKIREAYMVETGEELRDPGRTVRLLYELEFVERPRKGVYKYNPATSSNNTSKEAVGHSVRPKNYVFDMQTVEAALAKAKTSKDENARRCFQKMYNALKKHGIVTY